MVHVQSCKKISEKKSRMKLRQKAKSLALNDVRNKLKNNIQCDLNNALHQNRILKDTLRKTQSKKNNHITSNKFCTPFKRTFAVSKHPSIYVAKRSLCDFLSSMPVILMQSNITTIHDTNLKGVFGEISVVLLKNLPNMHAVMKRISLEKSKDIDILAEAKVMHILSGHILFPYCFGFIKPNIIISQFIGRISGSGEVLTDTVYKVMMSNLICKHRWAVICFEMMEGVKFLHGLGILHNDLKADNVLLYGPMYKVKIIDFGKCTLSSMPIMYNLSIEDTVKYNINHRHLAHELRNIPYSKQSELTDTYSVGYMIKHVGYYQRFDFLYNTGRKMKAVDMGERMTLGAALQYLQTLLTTFAFK